MTMEYIVTNDGQCRWIAEDETAIATGDGHAWTAQDESEADITAYDPREPSYCSISMASMICRIG